jgi:ferric-dicitrate binding protein FerR (iron transport regulator)
MDRLRYLLDSYAGGNCTEEEIQELHERLQADWASIRFGQQAPGVDWEKMYREIMVSRVGGPTPVRRLTKRWWYAAAAAVFILVAGVAVLESRTNHPNEKPITATTHNDVLPGGNKAILTLGNGQQIVLDSTHTGLLTQQGNVRISKTDSGTLAYTSTGSQQTDIVYNMLTCPRGGQFKLELPDGTDVWLNSASSIRYPTDFKDRERKVEITGEAYFEVARNEATPFVVETNNTEVKVLGTRFNINSYENEQAVKTTLLDGKISVTLRTSQHPESSEPAVLQPGQQAVATSALTIVKDVNVEQVMAWKNGYFSFKNADLTTVLRQLERWYDIDIKYAGYIPVRHFTGELSRDLTLSQVISVLSEEDVKFKIEGKTLTVMQ